MNAIWGLLVQQAITHLQTIEEFLAGIAAALAISGVFAIPEKFPGLDIQAWWTWIRDTLQGAVPMKFQKTTHVIQQSNPAEPGKES